MFHPATNQIWPHPLADASSFQATFDEEFYHAASVFFRPAQIYPILKCFDPSRRLPDIDDFRDFVETAHLADRLQNVAHEGLPNAAGEYREEATHLLRIARYLASQASNCLPPDQATRQAVDGTFGTGFSGELDKLKVGDWQGPVRSGLGLHLIRIERRAPGRLPDLDQIRAIVGREWSNEKRLVIREEMNRSMLDGYDIIIEWPKDATADKSADEADAP